MRKYEAASKSNRLSLWAASDKSANSELKDAAASLKMRARDLIRNNPWAGHAVDVISTMVVGDGVRPQINHTKDNDSKSVKKALEYWSDWADYKICDYDEERNIYQMQSAVMDAVVTDGECFIIKHKMPPAEMKAIKDKLGLERVVPLRLQLLESDFLNNQRNEQFVNGTRIIQGVEFDKSGRRAAYHFFKGHPGENAVISSNPQDTVRVPAEQVLHIYRKDRLHQARGVTWFTKVMIRLKDLDIYEDASLRKQQIAACYAAFITDSTADPGGESDAEIEILERLDSGSVEILPPGRDVKFSNPPSVADYPEFTKSQLRAIAAGLGITYESLTQDLSNTNFSSGRMGHIGMDRKVRKWQNQILIAEVMTPIFSAWIEAADLVTPGNMDMYKLYPQWTLPARAMIDPGKEVSANKEAIASGQTTVSEVLRSQGKDPEAVFEERAQELKLMDALGVITDSDPRQDKKPEPASLGQNPKAKPAKEGEQENADEKNPDEGA